MRAIAAAVVILAGTVLGAGAAVAHALPESQGRSGSTAALPAFGAALLIGIGLVLLLFGWDRADRRPLAAPPDRGPDLRN